MKTRTKGDVIVEDIKLGDIHYEYEYGFCMKSKVIEVPVLQDGLWEWKSENVNTGKVIEYAVSQDGLSYYGPNLYTYEAYSGCKMI